MKRVGVLALQGDFEAHQKALARAGAEAMQVRTPADLNQVDGLVIPGGESSTMLNLLNVTGMKEPLREFGRHKPIFGTCAGAILLASEVSHPVQESLRVLDMGVERNAYGRQLNSRVVRLAPEGGSLDGREMEAVFIRAPIIRRLPESAKVLARYNGDPVLVEDGRHLVATFHPELTEDTRIHELFLSKIEE
ncbi:MAG TPA: pyridoxal 5'-phosphate synthase glutaminase subunit PdxT [Bryobacteraceae bacterium]|nr:pyridoxal 5'-phosphate synthase glutaminase subunit PdxT [Bryobacteraceae bacterium]